MTSKETIFSLFSAACARQAEQPAVKDNVASLTYAEFAALVDRMAAGLFTAGVRPGTPVALNLSRQLHLPAAILAVLRLGGIYVPLDPTAPALRRKLCLDNIGATHVVCDAPCAELGGRQLLLTDLAQTATVSLPPLPDTAEVVAVIFTSGTTGVPKGVEITETGILRLARDPRYVALLPGMRMACLSNPAFDALTFEVFGALLNGLTLCIITPDELREPSQIAHRLREDRPDAMFLTSALFNLLAELDPACFATAGQVLVGGEPVRPQSVARVYAANAESGLQLINGYGPTECTTFALCHVIRREDVPTWLVNGAIPIGTPINQTEAYVLTTEGLATPVGEVGHLYLGGAGLARGYFGQKDLTEEKFVTLASLPGQRLYDTGDLVRQASDGLIHYVGRADGQVKVRGHRIELSEIEGHLSCHPLVRDVALTVVAQRDSNQIHAVLRCVEGPLPTVADLRAFLGETLPPYMIPQRFSVATELPRTANGKIDRTALSDLPLTELSPAGTTLLASDLPLAATLAIVAKILDVEPTATARFQELGGESLDAMRVVAHLVTEHGLHATVGELLAAESLLSFARLLRGHSVSSETADPEARYPAAREQSRLFFLQSLSPASSAYNETFAFDIEGPLQAEQLRAALNVLVARHAALRTRFELVDGVVSAIPSAPYEVDLPCLPEAEAEARCNTPFDLSRPEMLRASLTGLAQDRHLLFLTIHHIAIDGQSITEFLMQLSALLGGQPLASPAKPYQAFAQTRADFRLSEGYDRQIADWQQDLSQILPLGFQPLFPAEGHSGRAGGFHQASIGGAQWRALQVCAQEHGVSLFALLALLFANGLSRLTGRTDIAIGAPVANRSLGDFERLVGMCVNTVPFFVEIRRDDRLGDAVTRLDRHLKRTLARQDVDFDEVRDIAVATGRTTALFDTMLVLENTHLDQLKIGGANVTPRLYCKPEAKFPLTLFVTETSDGADLVFEYQTAVLSPLQITALADAIGCGASALPGSLALALGALSVGADDGRAQLRGWSEGSRVAIGEPWLPDAVKAHNPDDIAVSDQTGQMTYPQLDELSDAIAGGLSQNGIGPGDLVGICMKRSGALLACVLATWKLGAAYVPLDPSHPTERLSYLLADSKVTLVVVDQMLDPSVLPPRCKSVRVGDLRGPLVPSAQHRREARAYMMYTSGSTGLPKGVEITHGALANYLAHAAEAYCEGVAAAIVSSAFTFDATLTTLLAPLLAGIRIEMLPQDGAEVPVLARRLLTAKEPLLLKLTPTHLWAIRDYLDAPAPDFRHCVVVGGEAFSDDLARQYQALFPKARLINEYGPTETVVGCTVHEFDGREGLNDVPIGRPIRNVTLKLLNEAGQDALPGQAGELLIGGAGVGIGYYGRTALTAERFITLADGQRYYRSGDLARWSDEGQLLYQGRKDDQLKVRGYRIEPAEVEGPLRRIPGVTQAAVALAEAPGASLSFVGYVVCAPEFFDEAGMKGALRSSLPDHLIPDRIVTIDALPLTPNGKLDRAALPTPEVAQHLASATQTETVLRDLLLKIAEVVGYEIDPDMNFLESGLNSLMLMKLHAQLTRRDGFDFELVDFFTYPTPRTLARHLTGQQPADHAGEREPARIVAEDIAIIGMAINVSGAADLARFYETITRGQQNFVPVGTDRADPQRSGRVEIASTMERLFEFDPDYFGLSVADAELMDPQQRLILMGAVHALENAGLAPAAELAQVVGVFVSSSENQYQQGLLCNGAGAVDGFQMSLLNEKDFVSTRIAYHLNLTGPALTVQSACSSSLAAIHVACQHLRLGECELALAGGVSADPRLTDGYDYRPGRIFSNDGTCRAFGAESNGTVPANGMGLVVLKPLSRAVQDGDRVYAVIRGSAINNDGHGKVGFTAPSVAGQAAAIRRAMDVAGVAPSDIGYVEAHGTGTRLGDPVEFEALCQAFGAVDTGNKSTALGTVKSQLGHTASAAGVIGLIRAALGIYGRVLPATFGAERPNPHLSIDSSPFYLNDRPRFWRSDNRLAGVSSFGMGGTNAHLILGNGPELAPSQDNRPAFLPFSARTATALRSNIDKALGLLAAGEVSLASLAAVQRASKSHYPQRVGFQCTSTEDAIAQLSGYLGDGKARSGLSEAGQAWLSQGAKVPDGPKAPLPLDSLPYAFDRRVLRITQASSETAPSQRTATDCLYQLEWTRMKRVPPRHVNATPLVMINAPAALRAEAGAQAGFVDHMSEVAFGDDLTPLILFVDTRTPDCFTDLVAHLQAGLRAARGRKLLLTIAHAAGEWSDLLQGPRLVAPAEHPNLTARLLALSPNISMDALRGVLGALEDQSGTFALRGAYLWRKRLVQVPAPAGSPFKAGTHLVLGGTGGIGQHVVRALAEAAPSRILVVSRKSGADSLATCTAEQAGKSEIYHLRTDITDPDAMRTLASDITARFGPLASIYHCAGEVGSGLLMQREAADFSGHVTRSVSALHAIETALMPLAPELVVVAASMSAHFGVVGQSDYSAGHAYATSWAERMAATYPATQVTAVCWPTWQGTGLAAGLGAMTGTLAQYAITPPEGIAILGQVISLGLPSLQVCPIPPDTVEQALADLARRAPEGRQEQPSTVEDAFCRVLGVKHLGEDEDFFDHGGDSLSALDLLDLLDEVAPGRLALSDIMENPTVAGIRRLLATTDVPQKRSTLVELRPGVLRPVVCIAPIGGDVSGYRDISQRLRDGLGVLALRDPVFLGERPQGRSVSDLAKRYLADLSNTVPEVLVGWSFAAMVAYHMAWELQQAGRRVPKLVLIDPPVIGQHASNTLAVDAVVARELGAFGVSRPSDSEPGFRDAMATACQLNAKAMVTFRPSNLLQGCDAHLFVAKDGEAPPPSAQSRTQWLQQSWQPHFGRRLSVQTLSADHYSIMTSDYAEQIARTLSETAVQKQMDETLL